MKANVEIDAGICGFYTKAQVNSKDNRNVTFDIDTTCDKIARLAKAIEEKGAIDAYQEISPRNSSIIMMTAIEETLKGCCAGCAVPVGLFKGLQVATGLAVPKDISIKLAKES